jgi:drug/metabolite transporter, DME family
VDERVGEAATGYALRDKGARPAVAPAPPQQSGDPSGLSVQGLVRAFLATLCWSSSALLIDRLTTGYHLSALEISSYRIVLVLPLLVVAIALHRDSRFRIDPREIPWYLATGIGITVSNVTWAVSVQMNRPAAAAALGFSAPAFIALSERLAFRTHLRQVQVGAILVNLLGCGLASGIRSPGDFLHAPGGLLIGLGNGLAFTCYTLLNSHRRPRGPRDPRATLLYIFAIGELGILAWGIPLEGVRMFRLHMDALGWILLISVALGPTLGAYALFNSSLRLLPATIASLATTLEPPIVAIFAFVILGRTIDPAQWTGIVLIVSAVFVMQLSAAGLIPWGRPAVENSASKDVEGSCSDRSGGL